MSFLEILAILCLSVIVLKYAFMGWKKRRSTGRVLPLLALAAPIVLFLLVASSPPHEFTALVMVASVIFLALLWFREFVALMAAGDDCFPGRNDKLLWYILMLVMPPVGMIAFGWFRRSYWAEEKPATAFAQDLA